MAAVGRRGGRAARCRRSSGAELATELRADGEAADLIVGNNVLAHVPDLNGFVAGIKMLLKPAGVVTIEFPHLMRLVDGNQFDTIYHEHFSYFSFLAAERIFAAHGLEVFDVEELATPRRLAADLRRPREVRIARRRRGVADMRQEERAAGVDRLEYYDSFRQQVEETKRKLLELLIDVRGQGKTVVGYGAPGKGNTLLNYCGIRGDFLDFTVDRNPYKHGGSSRAHTSHRRAGEDAESQARLRVDPAVEPEGRDHATARPCPRLGRQVHRPDPRGEGLRLMSEHRSGVRRGTVGR